MVGDLAFHFNGGDEHSDRYQRTGNGLRQELLLFAVGDGLPDWAGSRQLRVYSPILSRRFGYRIPNDGAPFWPKVADADCRNVSGDACCCRGRARICRGDCGAGCTRRHAYWAERFSTRLLRYRHRDSAYADLYIPGA